MKRFMAFAVGFLAGSLVMIACGKDGVFPYKYYGIEMPAECYAKGKLLGKSGHHGWQDLPLTTCQPDPSKGNQIKCITALDGDFYDAKGAFLKCEQDLSNCEKRCK